MQSESRVRSRVGLSKLPRAWKLRRPHCQSHWANHSEMLAPSALLVLPNSQPCQSEESSENRLPSRSHQKVFQILILPPGLPSPTSANEYQSSNRRKQGWIQRPQWEHPSLPSSPDLISLLESLHQWVWDSYEGLQSSLGVCCWEST